jgi:hypothetical protein
MAQSQAHGVADPLGLAASGVLIPFVTEAGTVATLELASPVGGGPALDAHMVFFDATCVRGQSRSTELTENDVDFFQIATAVAAGSNGLVAISAVAADQLTLLPLPAGHPLHTRVYLFNASDGRSRILEPIIIDHAESPGTAHGHTWSPLRTGATFFAPQQTATVNTLLYLICPRNTIQSTGTAASTAAFGYGAAGGLSNTGFPVIEVGFPAGTTAGTGTLQVRIYDEDENFLTDGSVTCDCFASRSVTAITNSVDAYVASDTYTEIQSPNPAFGGTSFPFTGYRSVFTVGSPLNNFFGRLSNASRGSLIGPTVVPER